MQNVKIRKVKDWLKTKNEVQFDLRTSMSGNEYARRISDGQIFIIGLYGSSMSHTYIQILKFDEDMIHVHLKIENYDDTSHILLVEINSLTYHPVPHVITISGMTEGSVTGLVNE